MNRRKTIEHMLDSFEAEVYFRNLPEEEKDKIFNVYGIGNKNNDNEYILTDSLVELIKGCKEQ